MKYILLLAIAASFVVSAKEKTLMQCSSIAMHYMENGIVIADAVDEFTRNYSLEEAAQKATDEVTGKAYEFTEINGNCVFRLEVSQ